jgi:regulator of protease activity HflC (stomatin/prohibitin superfamily)
MIEIIKDGFAGLLYENGVFTRVLAPGRHVFGGFLAPQREIKRVDTRERSTTIKNQEILTSDKVAVRLSLLVYFKVTDPGAAVRNVENYEDRMYEDVQLAARRYLATRTLDQIFRDRNEISEAIRSDLKASALDYGVEIRRADVKDIVFPGNLREIMNRVIETERTTEARVVEARRGAEIDRLKAENAAQVARIEAESKAATAALALEADAKAAELAAARPELLKLKELEILKEIGKRGEHRFYVGVDKLSAKG